MTPFNRLRRGAALTLCALLALAASGCGPSSGGTGTGEGLVAFGATATSVCTSAFASQLGCTTSGNVGTPSDPLATGTTMTLFADLPTGGNVAVTFESNSVQVRARCQRIAFDGDWGIAAGNDARFFGNYVVEPAGLQVPASVSVQAVGAGELQLVLRETDGRVVLGPVRVQKVPAPAPQAPCP